jgi:SSS family solute:Na+ symporter
MLAVAVLGFFFSLLFKQTDYIMMFFTITGAIYIGGAGAVILGGLYWKRGTTTGAWSAMIVGSTLSVGFIALKQIFPGFPLDAQVLGFIAMLCAAGVYGLVSLMTCREDFNMERMLHRGPYRLPGEAAKEDLGGRSFWKKFLGIDQNFSTGDKILSIGFFSWGMFWFVVFVGVTLWNLLVWRWPIAWWSTYWYIQGIILPLLIGCATTVWFTWGCWHDMRVFFRRLNEEKVDEHDDGTVNREEEELVEELTAR